MHTHIAFPFDMRVEFFGSRAALQEAERMRSTPLVSIALTTLLGACAAGQGPGGSADNQGDHVVVLAAMQVNDADEAARMASDGALLYAVDERRRDGYEYCSNSIRLADAGEFRRAIREAQKALFLGRREGDDDLLGHATRDLAYAYMLAGDRDRAAYWADEAVRYGNRRTRNSAAILFGARRTLGSLALLDDRPAEARRQFEMASLEVDGLDVDDRDVARALVDASLARAAVSEGSFDEAEALLDAATSALPARIAPFVDRTRGDLALARGDHDAAIARYREIDRSEPYHRIWADAGVARARLAGGDASGALQDYFSALRSAEELRSTFDSDEFRVGTFGEVQDVYGEMVALLTREGRHREAFDVSERSRARATLDVVQGRSFLTSRASLGGAAIAEAARLDEVRSWMPEDTRLVAYHVGEDETLAWVVGRRSFEAVRIPRGRAYFSNLSKGLLRSASVGAPLASDLLKRLHDDLVAPLDLGSSTSIVFAPHGGLHRVPFAALGPPGRPLVASRAVSVAPSASILLALDERPNAAAERKVAFGNPDLDDPDLDLPGAEAEARSLADRFGFEALIGGEATETAFRSLAPRAATVHVAAHAVLDEVDPMYSSILLAESDEDDGVVEAHDFYRMRFDPNRTIVLSACETGVGRVTKGDDFWGFPRALLAAGSETLLLTLWKVDDDATAKLMRVFHQALEGASPAQALRAAQLSALEDPSLADPRFWAAFTLIGLGGANGEPST